MDDEEDVGGMDPTGGGYEDVPDYDEDYIYREPKDEEPDDDPEDPIQVVIEGTPGEEEEDPDETEEARLQELAKIEEVDQLMVDLGTAAAKAKADATPLCPNPDRRTEPVMTRYERARVLSARGRSLENNDPPMVEVGDITDPVTIALMELDAKVIPVRIVRKLPDGSCEIWNVNELTYFG